MTEEIGPMEFEPTRRRLMRASRLHGMHWLVIGLSLVLTFGAWDVTKRQVEEKIASQFDREASQVVDLVTERMRRYEDALWGGVGAHASSFGIIDRKNWRRFANTLDLAQKYPGINGIGVIHRVSPEQLPHYLARERLSIPDFGIHPKHDGREFWPITYVEPENVNREAIGLDMAHESNRFTAATKARDTGLAQITGPIVLVQDSGKTPGFLFYAPFYQPFSSPEPSLTERQHRFVGLVYAPFVARKLMQGVLDKTKRHVAFSIRDGQEMLYNELHTGEPDYDPDPLFKRRINLHMYGRDWQFNIWSAHSFRNAAHTNQPKLILLGGLLIDGLLFGLFVMLSRANRQALRYADQATEELRQRTLRLERSNADLEHFAYVASHDLKEPLRMVGNFSQLLRRHYADQSSEKSEKYFEFVSSGVQRMQLLLNDLLEYARVGSGDTSRLALSAARICEGAVNNLRTTIDDCGAEVDVGPLPTVHGDESQLTRLFQNLISNALKFRVPDRAVRIEIRVEEGPDEWTFSVADNGIGIEARYFEKIFVMFQRLHDRETYTGTGVGLAICKKIAVAHGGRIWLQSELGRGTTFFFTIPKTPVMTTGPRTALQTPSGNSAAPARQHRVAA